ncbi:hypothetical protein JDV09_26035 [Mycobacterium sp. Y57]|uniref:maleylpyruvate isomerase N-terminal domain-containing protein n=1 Tax=Mycolicibacterium xanthum TaxID=2796469 RepID=UPI001C854477|nr:maleylpyruvate isomerase N-terminal domain-containing protein [Mycolicibacterium xanthum]MBX7435524.1 hypothetical protein [Mycolicibacterium xanthum]
MADRTGDASPPRLKSGADAAAAYRLIRERVDTLLRGRADVAERVVSACPAWTVRQTLSHLAGGAQDVASQNLDGVATEHWTRAQVDRLSNTGIDELLDLWAQAIDQVTALVDQPGLEFPAGQLVFDALTHEHDIRGALGEPGARSADPALAVAVAFLSTAYDQSARKAGLPVLVLTTPEAGSLQLGDPDTVSERVALSVSDFEALRAFGGRRSHRQLLALPWQGDPTRVLAALGNEAVRPPADDLVE